jgi:hypothetical protein
LTQRSLLDDENLSARKPRGHPVDEVCNSGGTVGVDTQMFGPPTPRRDPSGRNTVYGRARGPALVATPHVPLLNQWRIGAQSISECGLEGGILELGVGCFKQVDKRDFIATFDDPCHVYRRHCAMLSGRLLIAMQVRRAAAEADGADRRSFRADAAS